MGRPLVTGTWLLGDERLSAVRRAASTASLPLEEPLALIVDERLAPRPGDVLLARVDVPGEGSGLLPGDELLVSHGESLADGTQVTPLGLLVDSRWTPVSIARRAAPPPRRTRGRRRLLGDAFRTGRLPAG